MVHVPMRHPRDTASQLPDQAPGWRRRTFVWAASDAKNRRDQPDRLLSRLCPRSLQSASCVRTPSIVD